MPFLRAGKVSIEEILETCFRKSLIMRTRPRLSGCAAKCGGVGAKHRLHGTFQSCERAHYIPNPDLNKNFSFYSQHKSVTELSETHSKETAHSYDWKMSQAIVLGARVRRVGSKF